MPGKMARSRDQTSFGTAGTPEALCSQPYGFWGTPPSAIVHAVPEFIWGTSAKEFQMRQVGGTPVWVDGDDSFEQETENIVLRIVRSQTGHAIFAKFRAHGRAVIVPYSSADAANLGRFNAYADPSTFTPYFSNWSEFGRTGFIHFSDSTWEIFISLNGRPFRLRFFPWSWLEPDEVLFHEMVHLARLLGGDFNQIKLKGQLGVYGDEEEFFAVLVTNIYMSEKGKDHKVALRGAHDWSTHLPDAQDDSDVFLDQDHIFELVGKFCEQHPNIAPMLAKVTARFNPIRAYYEWLKFPHIRVKTEETPAPIPIRITQRESRPALTDDTLVRLLAPRFRADDVAGYGKRVKDLEEMFGRFNVAEAIPLFARLTLRAQGDKVAMLFHHRLHHQTRQKLLDILRSRMVPR